MPELKRTLGVWKASAFTFLNLVNTGIFFGVAVGMQVAGTASILVWLALAVMSIYTAMCFAELSTMFPSAGGIYEFAKRAYGRFSSFQIGWTVWVVNNVAVALLVAAAIEYIIPSGTVIQLFGVALSSTTVSITLSILVIIGMNIIAYLGADTSAQLMLGLGIFTLALLLLIIVPGALELHTSHFRGITWEWSLILFTAFLLSETFFGWESISFLAEEIKDPERTIPRALYGTTVFVAVASVAIAAVTIGVLGPERIMAADFDRPLLEVLGALHMPHWILLLANLGIVVTFLGNAAGNIIGNPRLLMALARDKLFIEQFADVHPTRGTPYRAILLQTVVAVLIILLSTGGYRGLLEMVVAPSVIIYAAVLFLVPLFRWRNPDARRPYRTPFGSWLPLALVAFYLTIIAMWALVDPATSLLSGNPDAVMELRVLGGFLIFSIPIYIVLTYFYDPDVLILTMDRFAGMNRAMEPMLLPRRIRREIVAFLQDAHGHRVLELGSSTGALTMPLAHAVGPEGHVHAIDMSEQSTRILQRRVTRKGLTHVHAIHDPHLISRIHPSVIAADAVVSVGNLSYFQDIDKMLHDAHRILPDRGRIFFVEYIDFFWFLPNNPKWLSDTETVREIFSRAGFAVTVQVRKGLFWNYLFVFGIKEKSGAPYI